MFKFSISIIFIKKIDGIGAKKSFPGTENQTEIKELNIRENKTFLK
tara:strand:+ start:746 stop:883 length:138 start_codon:yes stop_codon:yes gene_type:complete